MFVVCHEVSPGQVESESIKEITTMEQARKYIKANYMNPDDSMRIVADFIRKDGKAASIMSERTRIQTIAIFAMDGEAIDVFFQLKTKI